MGLAAFQATPGRGEALVALHEGFDKADAGNSADAGLLGDSREGHIIKPVRSSH
jgi:hypothetical protein